MPCAVQEDQQPFMQAVVAYVASQLLRLLEKIAPFAGADCAPVVPDQVTNREYRDALRP